MRETDGLNIKDIYFKDFVRTVIGIDRKLGDPSRHKNFAPLALSRCPRIKGPNLVNVDKTLQNIKG